jgi:Mn-dependent DtxR family transcriptional regulator
MAHERQFSLDEDFMNYKTNDILYGFLRSLSTVKPEYENGKETYKEYLPKVEYVKNKKNIAALCGCSTKTIERHLDKLAEAGLIDEEIIVQTVINDKGEEKEYEYPSFSFPLNRTHFKKIDKELLKYLLQTRNANAIRVFLYLKNQLDCHKPSYDFTNVELNVALGYSPKTDAGMTYICESLAREGLIRYKEDYEYEMLPDGTQVKKPIKRLYFVANNLSQLPTVK